MFDRFGLIRFEAVPLARFGLQGKWRRLDKLQQEAEGLIVRYQEAAASVADLEQGRQDARDKDLDTAAAALRTGDEVPEAEHEAKLDEELSGAVRSRDTLLRAAEGAVSDTESYRAKHASALASDIEEALTSRARALAEHASRAQALYAEVEDGRLLARRFGPAPAPPQENTGAPQDTTVLIGPMTTGTIAGGPTRGEIEAVLNYLSSLAQPVTVVGDGETAA